MVKSTWRLPDWLLAKGFEVRTNDERYFAEVYRFMTGSIRKSRLQLKEGGPTSASKLKTSTGTAAVLQTGGRSPYATFNRHVKEIGFDVPYLCHRWVVPLPQGYYRLWEDIPTRLGTAD